MKSIHFLVLILMFNLHGFSQDTLYYKDSKKIVVLVKEVSQTEIQYKKIELPDGPMYITNKSEIQKIVYKNGYSETVTVEAKPVDNSSQGFTVYNATSVDPNHSNITYSDTKRRNYSIISLIDRHPDKNRHADLQKIHHSMRGLKAGQDATRTVSIVFGGLTIASGALVGLVNLYDSNAGGFEYPITFGSVAVLTCAAAIAFNINLKKKRHDFVRVYNE